MHLKRSRWRDGLDGLQQWPCHLKGPGFESPLRPVGFFACNKVSLLNNQTPTLRSVPCASITQLKAIKVTCKKHSTNLLLCVSSMPGSSGAGGASSIASWLSEQDWQLAAAVTPRCPLAKHPQHERRFLLRSTDSLSSSSLSALSVGVSSARWSGVSSTNHYIQQVTTSNML